MTARFALCALAACLPSLAVAQECADPDTLIADAERDVVSFYLTDATRYADQAVAALACSAPAQPTTVARLFNALGVIRLYGGDTEGAASAFRDARAIDAETWNEDYGEQALTLRQEASPTEGQPKASLSFKGGSPDSWLTIDGTEVEWSLGDPVQVSPGLHVVQSGTGALSTFAKVVDLQPAASSLLQLPGEQADIVHTPTESPVPPAASPVWLHLAGGLSGAIGVSREVAVDDGTRREPAGKLFVPVELGAGLQSGRAWVRAVGGAAPILGGSWLYSEDAATWHGTPVALSARLDVGVTVDPVHLGVGSGVIWPGRIPVLAQAIVPLANTGVDLELHAGVRLATARSAEPTVAVLLSYRLR